MSEKTKKKIDVKPIEDLAKILDDLNLTEISYSDGDFSVSVSKAAVAQTMSPTITPVSYTHLTLPTTSPV